MTISARLCYNNLMISSDKNTQKMLVTVTYEYDEEIFDGENDMYEVAEDAKKYIEEDIYTAAQSMGPVENFKVNVKPQLT